MICFYCKGTTKNSTTTHVVKQKTCIIIIKNVPCTECVQCGATFYDNDVALQIERIVRELKTAITEVAIVNYSAA
jgi:YgiT-type zinc finger domain-containing protein